MSNKQFISVSSFSTYGSIDLTDTFMLSFRGKNLLTLPDINPLLRSQKS